MKARRRDIPLAATRTQKGLDAWLERENLSSQYHADMIRPSHVTSGAKTLHIVDSAGNARQAFVSTLRELKAEKST